MQTQKTEELCVSNELIGDCQQLRERVDEDGYLFLRGVVPKDVLLSLRGEILAIFAEEGWLSADSAPSDARVGRTPTVEGEVDYFCVYDRIQRLQSFHKLAHQPALQDVMRAVVGDSAFPHPLGIARLVFPDNEECTTPPHQDFPNNQGTADLYAGWIPLGDCPRQLGGLSILEGSHRLGLLPLDFSLGAGGRQARLPMEADDLRWLSTDFRCGDLLVFHSLTLHRSLPNLSGDRFRLSVDYRFQEEGAALTETVLQPHFGRLSWEEIYHGWTDRHLCYYWRDKNYEIAPWNEQLHELPPEHLSEAVRLARAWQKRRQEKRG